MSALLCFELKAQICQRVEECYLRAEQHLGRQFVRAHIAFNQRGKIAGAALMPGNKLKFNSTLLADNREAFIREVVPHEVCHLLVWQLYPGQRLRPHGKEWQGLMKTLFNLPGKATHQMDVSKVAGKTFAYRCHCGPVTLSVRRHNKVVRQQQQYICRRCQTRLSPAVP